MASLSFGSIAEYQHVLDTDVVMLFKSHNFSGKEGRWEKIGWPLK